MSFRYTVSIPQWIQGKDAEGEAIVLYRVNVLLQSPEDTAQASSSQVRCPFFVLRRYSQFRELYEQLKAQLPEVMRERGHAPPPKHALHIGGQKEMLDRRKEELERWLWRLISKPDLARSQVLRGFLEMEKAVSRYQSQQKAASSHTSTSGPSPGVDATGGVIGSFAPPGASAGGDPSVEWDDARSEASSGTSLAPSSVFSHLRMTGGGINAPPSTQHHLVPQQQQQQQHQSQQGAGGPAGTEGGGAAAAAAAMRLGVKLEARGDVRRLVEVLQQRLTVAGRDLQSAISEVQMLTEANRLVGQRVVELEGQLRGGRSDREVQLERELSELKASAVAAASAPSTAAMDDVIGRLEASEDIRIEVCARLADAEARLSEAEERRREAEDEAGDGRSRNAQLGARLAELEAALADGESVMSSRVGTLGQQVTSLQQQLADAREENKGLLSKMRDWGISAPAPLPETGASPAGGEDAQRAAAAAAAIPDEQQSRPSLSGRIQTLEQDLEAALSRAEESRAEVAELKAQAAKERDKVRSDQVVLAKEIRKLRAELSAAIKAQSDVELEQHQLQRRQSTDGASSAQLLAEARQHVADLEQRAQWDSAEIGSLQGRLSEAMEAAAAGLQAARLEAAREADLRWSFEEARLQAQLQGLREELSAVLSKTSTARDAAGSDALKVGEGSGALAEERGSLLASEASGRDEDLLRLKEELRECKAQLSLQTNELQELRHQLHDQQQLAMHPSASESAFEAEKSLAAAQAASAAREMELHHQLAAARAERHEAEQRQACLEADLGNQLSQALRLLGSKEEQLADMTSRVEEVRAMAAAAAAGREAELNSHIVMVDAQMDELREFSTARANHASHIERSLAEAHKAHEEALACVAGLRAERALLQEEVARLRDATGEARGALDERERLWSQQAEDASRQSDLDLAASRQQAQLLRSEVGVAEERLREQSVLLQAAREALGRSEEALASERAASIRLWADVRAVHEELRLLKGGAGRLHDEREATVAADERLSLAPVGWGGPLPPAMPVADGETAASPSSMPFPSRASSSSAALLMSGMNERLELRNQELQSELDAKEASNAVLRRRLREAEAELETLRPAADVAEGVRVPRRETTTAPANEVTSAPYDSVSTGVIRSTLNEDGVSGGETSELVASSESRVRELVAQVSSLEARLAVMLTVEQQCQELKEQVVALQRFQSGATSASGRADMAGGKADLLDLFADGDDAVVSSALADLPDFPALGPNDDDDDDLLSLDVSGLSIATAAPFPSESLGPPRSVPLAKGLPARPTVSAEAQDIGSRGLCPSRETGDAGAGASASTAAATSSALAALESEVEGFISEALGEAGALLAELKEAEAKAARLTTPPAAGGPSTSHLDAILAGFTDVGESVQRAMVKAATGLRQPSLLWSGSASAAVRSSERQLRDLLSEAVSELATRGAALNEARCDRLLTAALEEAPAAAAAAAAFESRAGWGPAQGQGAAYPTGVSPAAAAPWMPSMYTGGGGYQPPPVTQGAAAAAASSQVQRQPLGPGGGGGASAGANVLGSLGQRMSEAMTTHWTGLGTAFGGAGGGGAGPTGSGGAVSSQLRGGSVSRPGSSAQAWTGGQQAYDNGRRH